MHMADALISPAVGAAMWAAAGGIAAYCGMRVKKTVSDSAVPLMGVLGAFIFAAQMINFSIPGTGSSGHLGGGLILAILVGPCPAFVVMASVLTVQALLFADGGILALGCNIFNLGFFPAFVAYPLIYRPLARMGGAASGHLLASVLAAVIGLELGAVGVVVQTTTSGITNLPFGSFLLLMMSVHLAIGIGEGLATAAVTAFIGRVRPELLLREKELNGSTLRPVVVTLAYASLFAAAFLSWFASQRPDGLEWAIAEAAGEAHVPPPSENVRSILAAAQEKTALFPDYRFPVRRRETFAEAPEAWPAVSAETSAAGLVGGLVTVTVVSLCGLALRRR